MMARRGKTLPADHAPDRPRTEGGRDFYHDAGNTLGGLTATDETREAARRAVTHVHLHRPETLAQSAEVFFALGLAEPRSTPAEVSGPSAVTCPYCHVGPGARCVSAAGNEIAPHQRRYHRAELVRAGLAPEELIEERSNG